MPINTKKIKKKYNELNESKKAILREKFLMVFDYKNTDSFYKKMEGKSPFWQNEKTWLARKLKTNVKNLFI